MDEKMAAISLAPKFYVLQLCFRLLCLVFFQKIYFMHQWDYSKLNLLDGVIVELGRCYDEVNYGADISTCS